MAQKIIKNLIAIGWIGIAIYAYFRFHTYYTMGWNEIGSWLFLILLIPLIYFCYAIYKWVQTEKTEITIKITSLRLLAALLLLILITGNSAFLIRDPGFYTGNDLIYEEDENGGYVYEGDINTASETSTLVVAHQSTLEKVHEGFNWLPVETHEKFKLPTFINIQVGLITKSLGMLLALGLIAITAVALGFTILKKSLGKETKLGADHALISIGLGLFVIAVASFILGAFHFLNIYSAWAVFAIFLAISHKSIIQIAKKIFNFEYEFKTKIFNFNLLLFLVFILFFGVNFIDNITPLPRGWDGLNQYINTATRIFENSGLIQTGGTYYWELIMSLGLTMFNWVTITLNLASLFPATLAIIALYVLIRKFASQKSSLIATAAIYLTPFYLFHGVEENKVDMGTFLIGILSFLALYLGLNADSKKEKFTYLGIAGVLCGFLLGIKLTALVLIFAVVTLILHNAYKWKGAISGIFIGIGAFLITGNVNMGSEVAISNSTFAIVGLILVAISVLILGFEILKKKKVKGLKEVLIFGILAILAFSPWMIKNFSETHTLSARGLLFGVNPQPTIDHQLLSEEYDLNVEACTVTGTHEELDRYLGYDSFIKKYVTLPWNLTMNTQGPRGTYVDIGWVFLGLLPVLLLFIPLKKASKKWQIVIWFGLSYWIFWIITSNGIIWYGLPGFIALAIWIAGLIDNYEKKNGKFGKVLISLVVTVLIISSLVFRLGSAGKGTLLLYTADVIDREQALTSTFTYGLVVQDYFEQNEEGLIWKIGTPLNYFISDNYWRTYNDQYLDDFNCLYQDRNPELLTEMFKTLGFEYIIFDYYTYTLSPDPESTLKDKYDAAFDYLANYTDMIVPDNYRGHFVFRLR